MSPLHEATLTVAIMKMIEIRSDDTQTYEFISGDIIVVVTMMHSRRPGFKYRPLILWQHSLEVISEKAKLLHFYFL